MPTYSLVNKEDLETIEAGDGVVQTILKEGAVGVDFEVEAADPEDLAKMLMDAAEPEGEGEPLVKLDGESPAPDEDLRKAVTEGFSNLAVQLGEFEKRLAEVEKSPGARPMIRSAPGAKLEDSPLTKSQTDDADKLEKSDQVLLDQIGGHEGTSLEEAEARAIDWARQGVTNQDPEKKRLAEGLVDLRMRARS